MKSFLIFSLIIFSIPTFAQTFNVDQSKSKIVYVGKKVTGQHTGTITLKSGKISLKDGVIVGGEFIGDMNSLTSTDITDPEYNTKYVTHMKSSDFFDTQKYPETKVVIKGSKKIDNGLEVKADLTLLGITKAISFLVKDIKVSNNSFSGKSNLTLNRTKWGLKYGSSSFIKGLGDKAINDDFNLTVEILANK